MKQVKNRESKTVTPDQVSGDVICLLATRGHASLYKLNRVGDNYDNCSDILAFVDLEGCIVWANGTFSSVRQAIEAALKIGDVYVFDSAKEMAQFIVERKA